MNKKERRKELSAEWDQISQKIRALDAEFEEVERLHKDQVQPLYDRKLEIVKELDELEQA